MNGDGYDDVLVGAFFYDAGETDEGAAFIFLGAPAGIAHGGPASADAVIEADQSGARVGISVAGAGDVNGDGAADLVVGADSYDAGEPEEGAAFVVLPEPGALSSLLCGVGALAVLARTRERRARGRR